MNEQRFPAGWDQQRVQRLLAELECAKRGGVGGGGRSGGCGGRRSSRDHSANRPIARDPAATGNTQDCLTRRLGGPGS